MKTLSDGKVQAIGRGVRALLVGALLAIGLAPSAWADIYTYTYVGNPLTNCAGPGCITSAPFPEITASFTLGSALGDSLPYGAITPISWNITDGFVDLNNTNSALEFGYPFDVATSATGQITLWDFFAEMGFGIPTATTYTEMYTSNIPTSTGSYCCPEDASVDDAPFSGPFTPITNNGNFFEPGIWTLTVTTTAVPEPRTSVLLLATALLGLGAMLLRRKRIA